MSVAVASLLITHNRLRSGSAEFKLCVHFLQARSQRFNLLLLPHGIRFQFLHFAVLFEKLIEQHRVDLLVANRLGLSLRVAPHQIGVHFGYLLSDEAKGKRLRGIILPVVAEADRLQRVECFAGFVHRLDVVFIPARRYIGPPKSAVAIHSNIVGVYSHNRLHRVRDVANASGVILASNAMYAPADADIAVAREEVASCDTNGRVTASGRVVERVNTDGRVEVAGVTKRA